MTFAHALMRDLAGRDTAAPRVVWYGPGSERIELSGRVLDNWVAKTANLLAEEFDVAPGSEVVVLLPPHWRSLVVGLAVWTLGARLTLADGDASAVEEGFAGAAAVFTDSPAGGLNEIAVALPGLAMRFDGDPAGTLDYNAEVRSFPDVIAPGSTEDPAPEEVALSHPRGEFDYGTLAGAASGDDAEAPGARMLFAASGELGPGFFLDALRTLHRRGRFVIAGPGLGDQVERIAAAEGIDRPGS